MISTISPLVQEDRRQWILSTTLFATASAAGGAATFGAAGVAGFIALASFSPLIRWVLFSAIAFVLVASGLELSKIRLPMNHRSVPRQWWRNWGPNKGALAYGFGLGLGVTTVIPFESFYLLLAWALCATSPVYGLVLGIVYGLSRALPVVGASAVLVRMNDHYVHPRLAVPIVAERLLARAGLVRELNGFAGLFFLSTVAAAIGIAAWST